MNPLDAECRKRVIPTENFYLYEQENSNTVGAQVPIECVEACQACSIRITCLDWALDHEAHGYWASTRRNRRMKLRRQLGIRISNPTTRPPWMTDEG